VAGTSLLACCTAVAGRRPACPQLVGAPPPPPRRHARPSCWRLLARRVGDKVRLDVLRDGKRLSMTVTLCERALGVSEE
jgi:hypothetical protein